MSKTFNCPGKYLVKRLHVEPESRVSAGQEVATLKPLEVGGMVLPSDLQLDVPVEAPVSGYVWLWPAARVGATARKGEELFSIMDSRELADMKKSGSKKEMVRRSVDRLVDAVAGGGCEAAERTCRCCGLRRSEFRSLALGMNWTGVLQRFASDGVCERCAEVYGEAFGLFVPWTDRDWQSEHRRNLALSKSAADIDKLLAQVPERFEEVVLFGQRRLLYLLQQERDSVQSAIFALVDQWSAAFGDDDWDALSAARETLVASIDDLRRSASEARSVVDRPGQLKPRQLEEAIVGVREHLGELREIQVLLDTAGAKGVEQAASRLCAKVGSLNAIQTRLAGPCGATVAHAKAEALRAEAAASLGDSAAVRWDRVEPPDGPPRTVVALAQTILRDQEAEIDRASELAKLAGAKLDESRTTLEVAIEKEKGRKAEMDKEGGALESSLEDVLSHSREVEGQHNILAFVGGLVGLCVAAGLAILYPEDAAHSSLIRFGVSALALAAAGAWVGWHMFRRGKKIRELVAEASQTESEKAKLENEVAEVVEKLEKLAADVSALE